MTFVRADLPLLARSAAKPFLILARAGKTFEPWVLLATRTWLGQAFLVLQVTMIMHGQGLSSTLSGRWWSEIVQEVAASGPGAGLRSVCPILLMLGLATRPAAGLLLIQTLLLQRAGEHAQLHVFWAVLLASLFVRGAGPLSLDRLFHGGVVNSALPGARRLATSYRAMEVRGMPLLLVVLRLMISVVVILPHAAAHPGMAPSAVHGMTAMLPRAPMLIAKLPDAAAILTAAALVVGFGVRPLAIVLLFLAPAGSASLTGDTLYWLLLLGFLVVQGAGRLSLDSMVEEWLREKPSAGGEGHHVVIVGGGFAGCAVARGLARAACRVTLIDQRNYHLFQPLLYQVATAGLSPADIATPIRGMLRQYGNVRVVLGMVDGVDRTRKSVEIGMKRIDYDTLVIATGARHAYFGRDEWSAFAPGLKTIEDATSIRARLLLAFETAETADDPETRAAWQTFVVVGGGPTGVELAGAIAELARFGMAGDFRGIDPTASRVVLVQSASRLLPTFPESLSIEAANALERLGVEVLLDDRATTVDAHGVTTSGARIPARTVLWAAGVEASPAARWLGAAADRAGRVIVGADLRVPDAEDIFVIGDTCASMAWEGHPVPGLAPAAKQAGAYVAKTIRAKLLGKRAPRSFAYRHYGRLATIGRKAAVADFGRLRCKGALAWWLWGAAHIVFLIDGRNRAGVVVEWLWDYFTLRRGTRLITGLVPSGQGERQPRRP